MRVKKPSRISPKRKPLFTAKNVTLALPFVEAGLTILSNIANTKALAGTHQEPIAAASRAISGLSATVQKLEKIRTQVVTFEQEPEKHETALRKLRVEQDVHTDLLLTQLKGNS